MRCPHVGAVPEHDLMSEEQHTVFVRGELPHTLGDRLVDRVKVLVCNTCFVQFKKASEDIKFWDWDGLVEVVTVRKRKPIAEQPLDNLFEGNGDDRVSTGGGQNPDHKSSQDLYPHQNPGAIWGEAAPN
jgi:hypothetical protein